MIGIFDSGVGGLASCRELRSLMPREDIIYLADRKNAPYGTKSENELIKLVSNDIALLTGLGADAVLIACCTASALHPSLPEQLKKIAYPIIPPSAKAAAHLGSRITVIATDYTVRSRAFSTMIRAAKSDSTVTEISAQNLVSLVENGARDGRLSASDTKLIDSIADSIRATSPDVLVLGCTHFSHLEHELSARLAGVSMVSPALVGAHEFAKQYRSLYPPQGRGRTVYL